MDMISKQDSPWSAEERLARERAILQYVVENIPYQIFWKDHNSVFLGCNKNFAAMDGRSDPKEMIGKTDYDTAWGVNAEEYRRGDAAVMALGEPILNKEEVLPDKSGYEKVILTSKVPLRDEAGAVIGLLGIIVDITERKRIEIELQRAKEAAEQATRVKGDFISSISHELRTPLTLILGPVREALSDPSLSAGMRQMLERVQRNGYRLYNLVNDVLDSAKAEAGRISVCLEPFDAIASIRAVVGDMEPLAQARGLDLQFSSTVDTLPALLDPKLFERILLNLVGNALKFTPPGGWVHVRLSTDARGLCIEVVDNGIGIPRSARDRLFQPFVQVDNSATRRHEGSGLGLALVRHFADAMGGTVGVESEEGNGSTFSVCIPVQTCLLSVQDPNPLGEAEVGDHALGNRAWQQQIAASLEVSAASMGIKDPGAADDRPRVLVADDNPDMRAFIVETLERDFQVVAVENGMRAWEMLQVQRVDLVVSDVMMPELNGLALTAMIKANSALKQVPVLLLTARGGAEAISSGLDVGADDYLSKPFAADELRARARAAVRMSRLQEELQTKSRQAGMATVAAGILHNLGNVLNSVNVSTSLLGEKIQRSRVGSVQKLARLLSEHADDLAPFLTEDERGTQMPVLLSRLADHLVAEQQVMMKEMAALKQQLEHVNSVVMLHRDLATTHRSDELFAPVDVVGIVLRMSASSIQGGIQVEQRLEEMPLVRGDKHKAIQILINLVSNACLALQDSARDPRVIQIVTERQGERVRIVVSDNGSGIAPEIRKKLFTQGFTTRKQGSGLGLHTSGILAQEMGGVLTWTSDGPGQGATFVLELPAAVEHVEQTMGHRKAG